MAGDKIRYAPKSSTPSDLVQALREHKAEVLAYLQQEAKTCQHGRFRQAYPGDGQPDREELWDIVRRVRDEGYVLLWSTVLADLVAFYKTEADRKKIPPGFVPYSDHELWELFGEGKIAPSPGTLKLIHEAKKQGGRVISSEPEHGESGT